MFFEDEIKIFDAKCVNFIYLGFAFDYHFSLYFSRPKIRGEKGKNEASKITKLTKNDTKITSAFRAYFSLYKIIFIYLLTHIREKSSI